MKAQTERQYDDYERMSYSALMGEIAHRAKKPKTTDLFKRPSGNERKGRKSAKELREQFAEQQALLAQFTFAKKT